MSLTAPRNRSTGSESTSRGKRIGRTAEGKFVPFEHPDAAYLAYTEYDEVPQEVLDSLSEGTEDEEATEAPEEDSKPAEDHTKPQETKPRRARTKG